MKTLPLILCVALCFVIRPAGAQTNGGNLLARVQSNPQLSTLAKLLTSPPYARIAAALANGGDRTLFAPTDAAFAALPDFDARNVRLVSATLLYHIVPQRVNSGEIQKRRHAFLPTLLNDPAFVNLGSGKAQVLQINARSGGTKIVFGKAGDAKWEAHIVTPDVSATNGVIHVIDKVLMVPRGATEAARLGGFDALITNLQQTGLLGLAENSPGITIFAPTNAAFQAFQAAHPNADRGAVMKRHLVPNVLYSPQLTAGQSLPTLGNGKAIRVERNGALKVNGVTVPTTDVLLKNGVVHLIDAVLPE